jgi:hypothetical protein
LKTYARDSGAALNWYEGLKEAILGLREKPQRCPAAPEDSRLRHLLYGTKPHIYRVAYRVWSAKIRFMVQDHSYLMDFTFAKSRPGCLAVSIVP